MALQLGMICSDALQLFDLTQNSTLAFLETLIAISHYYNGVHRWLSLFMCGAGTLLNMCHIAVLTRPALYKSAVNRLLSYIAVCDLMTMASYIVFTIRFSFMIDSHNPPVGYELGWIVFLLGHVVCSIALHTITLYLSVATAYIRYKALDKLGSKWLQDSAAGPIALCIVGFVSTLCIPTFIVHSILQTEDENGRLLYTVGLAEFKSLNSCRIFKLNLWLTGLVFKVAPCMLMLFFTAAILYKLEQTRRRRRLIVSGGSLATKRVDAHSDRTTRIILVMLSLFLSTEMPQGLLSILNGLYPNDIHQFVYLQIGDVLDALSLINCYVGPIACCFLSSQYRDTLRSFFRERAVYRPRSYSAVSKQLGSCEINGSMLRFNDDRDVLL